MTKNALKLFRALLIGYESELRKEGSKKSHIESVMNITEDVETRVSRLRGENNNVVLSMSDINGIMNEILPMNCAFTLIVSHPEEPGGTKHYTLSKYDDVESIRSHVSEALTSLSNTHSEYEL